jgi:hypothetical protein
MSTLDTLPETLHSAVLAYMQSTGRDYTSRVAMRSRCEDESRALAYHLDAVTDEWGDRFAQRSWVEPAPRDGDELARGHVVCCVVWGLEGETWAIDLTAAQFGDEPGCWLV